MIELPSRYEHRRLLGEGGMGQVHLVFDRERGEELALKRLLAPAGGEAGDDPGFLFRQEYWSMVSLRHSNLVAAHDYGELGDGTPYFTMELVPGRDLEAGRADEAAVRAWLPGIGAALAYLHGRGFVHADLKPENVRLREDGVPKLMDLGLLGRVGRPAGAIRGTVLYMAPEAIRQAPLDGRTDLYALGAILFHLLAGRPPFEQADTLALLRAHLDSPAPTLEGVSPAMAAAVASLLAKDPARRPTSVAALLAMLDLPAGEEVEAGLLGSPLVGRADEEARLAELLGRREAASLTISGPSGIGKTRLLEETRARAQLAGIAAIAVQGVGADAPPYQAVRPLLRALIGPPSPERDRLAPILVKLAPELASAPGLEGLQPAPALEGAQERARLHGAVAELARARWADALWLVDDADQLDQASRELLNDMRRRAEGLPWRWLRAAAEPAEEDETLALRPLAEAESLEVCRALLGQATLPAALAERAPLLSGGSPGAIEALLAHWLRVGALTRAGDAWTAGPAEAFELPGGLQVALDARFQDLEPAARRLGRVAAVLGATGELSLLAAVGGLPDGELFAALAALEGAELLVREDAGYRFVRPVQATALAASWSEAERRALHQAAADWLRARLGHGPDAPAAPLAGVLRVARHMLAGERPLEAVDWVIAGVRRALALFALDAAQPLLEGALALDGLDEPRRLALQVQMAELLRFQDRPADALALFDDQDLLGRLERADAPGRAREGVSRAVLLMQRGRYDEAIAAFTAAAACAAALGQADEQARAYRFLGRTCYFAGRTDEALAHLRTAVEVARTHGLDGPLASALGFYGYLLASKDLAHRDEGLAMIDEALALHAAQANANELTDTWISQGSLLTSIGRFADALAVFERALANAGRLGLPGTVMIAHVNLAVVKLELGDLPAARDHAQTVYDMGLRAGRKFYQAYGLALAGLAATRQGEPASGPAQLDRALEVARELGNRVAELFVRVSRCEALVLVGRAAEAGAELAEARKLAGETKNDEHDARLDRLEALLALHAAIAGPGAFLTPAQSLLALPPAAAPTPAAQALAERFAALVAAARARDPVATAHALAAQALAHTWLGAADDARDAARQARELAGEHGLQLLAAELDALQGWLLDGTFKPMSSERLTAALTAARALGCAPLALWAEAMLAEQVGDRRTRRACAQRLRDMLAELGPEAREAWLSWPERRSLLEVGEAGGVGAERLARVLEIVGGLDPLAGRENVVAAALTGLIELTGMARGFLLLYEDAEVAHRAFFGMDPDDSDDFSSTLADQVYWSGKPLFVEDAQGHAGFSQQKSIQALGLRTVVGLPLRARGDVIGVLIADSKQVTAGFGPAEMEAALALADQVALAIVVASELDRADQAQFESERLHALALATAGAPDMAAFMAPLAAEALALTGAERCFLVVGDQLECRLGFDAEGRPLPAGEQQLSSSVCRWVLEHGESLYLADAQQAEDFQHQKSVMALALRMVYAVPVAHDGRRLGVLYLHAQRVGHEDPATLRMLGRIGELVGAYMARSGAG